MSFYLSGGVEVLGFISPTEPTDEYPVIDPLYGIDGFRNVNTLSDLNSIPNLRRRAGMVVGVSGGTQYYKLNPLPWNGTITDWSTFNSGSGGGAFTGGTVTGDTIFTQGLTATTFYATTYLGLPLDVYVTGGTYSNGTITFTNNSGGTFNVTGLSTGTTINLSGGTGISISGTSSDFIIDNTLPDQIVSLSGGTNIKITGTYPNFDIEFTGVTSGSFTGGTVTGNTIFTQGVTATTFSASTYLGLPLDVYTTGFTFNPSTYDISIERNDGVTLTQNLGILATDVTITGGTYDPLNGSITFVNNTGGTFTVTGFLTGFTDIQVTGYTYQDNTFTISDSSGNTFSATIDVMTGLTINGNLSVTGTTSLQGFSATTISATTIGTSGDCVDDIYVSNIHSCSPLNINPLNEGNVYFGSTSGVTFDLINNKVGIGTSTPSTIFHVVGNYTGGTDALIPQMLFQNSNTIPNTNKTAIIRTSVGTGSFVGGYPEIWLESQETSTGVGLTKLRTVSNHPLLFYTNDIERARFGETGNFGINTQSPAGKLHVRTTTNQNIIFTSGTTGNQILSLVDGNVAYTGLTLDSLNLNLKTNGLDRVVIDSSGNVGIGTTTPTTKLQVSGTTLLQTFTGTTGLISAATQNVLTIVGSGNTTSPSIFTVQGSSGELFSVSDSLVGSLFSVNDISGLPVIEAFSNNTILMGSYLAPSLNTTTRVIATTGTTNVYSIPTSAYTGAFFDYTVSDGTNLRAGNIMSIWSGTSVNITETQTTDFGNTSGLTFNMVVSSGNAILRTSGVTGNWTVKTIVRSI